MNMLWRRNYKWVIAAILCIGGFLAMGSVRVISYNFGEGAEIDIASIDHGNTIDLFDKSVVHEISVNLSAAEYESMVLTYQETGEKEYFRTTVTIDGVTIDNVGIRLKGNLTLRQALGGQGNGQMPGGPGGMDGPMDQPDREGGFGVFDIDNIDLDNPQLPPFITLPEDWDSLDDSQKRTALEEALNQNPGMGGNQRGGFGGPGGETDENGELIESNPPYLIKFDAFVQGQTYQGMTELALRLGSDESLLAEPVAFTLHKAMGQIVPETSYGVVSVAENDKSLYVLAEHPSESYIDKYFPGEDGILYKAGNFVALEYLGDDPTLYADSFEQKTNKGDDDMSQLIAFFKFITESSDTEFANDLAEWIDIESMVRTMALDDMLENTDSFGGMGSNYYLFYSKTTEQFTLLSWDQNLALGSMGGMNGGGMNRGGEMGQETQNRQDIMQEWLDEGGFGDGAGEGRGGPGRQGNNLLKERFMANEEFATLYQTRYDELYVDIFETSLAQEVIETLSEPFVSYNAVHGIVDQDAYLQRLESVREFFSNKSNTNK